MGKKLPPQTSPTRDASGSVVKPVADIIKTRSVTKRLREINASIESLHISPPHKAARISSLVSRLEQSDLGRTRTVVPTRRPCSRPLLSSTRGDLDDPALDVSDAEDLTPIVRDVATDTSQHSEAFLTLGSDPEDSDDESVRLAAAPSRIRKEVWEVARSLSDSRSPSRLAAALIIVADEAGRSEELDQSRDPIEEPLNIPVDPILVQLRQTADAIEQLEHVGDQYVTDPSLADSVEIPPVSPVSVCEAAAMAEAAAAAKAEAATDVYVEASLLWDDFCSTVVSELPKDAVKSLAADADAMSKRLVTQYIAVRRFTAEQLPEIGDPVKIVDMKKLIIGFRERAWGQLAILDKSAVSEPAQPPAANTQAQPDAANVQPPAPPTVPASDAQPNGRPNTVPPSLPSYEGQGSNGNLAPDAQPFHPRTLQGIQQLRIGNRFLPGPRSEAGLSGMSAGTEEVVNNRVNNRKGALLLSAGGLVDRLNQLVDQHPESNAALQELENSLEIVKAEAKDVVDDLKELLTLAMSVGHGDAAQELADAVDEVGAARTTAMTSVRGARAELGMPMGAALNQVQMNLKAPVFKGDYRDNLDFYTFEREFSDLMDSYGKRSHAEKLLKLKADCLQGAAKDAVKPAKTFTQAMSILRQLYAKPEILLAVKSKEIKNLGSCPEDLQKKQRWYINISHMFREVREIAEVHEIEDFLAASDLTNLITSAMLKHDKNEFEKRMVKSKYKTRGIKVTKAIIADRLDEFIMEMIENVGCTLDYRITNQYGNTDAMYKNLFFDEKEAKPTQKTNNLASQNRRGAFILDTGGATDSDETDSQSTESITNNGPEPSHPVELTKRQKKKQRQAGKESEIAAAIAVASAVTQHDQYNLNRGVVVNRAKDPKQMKCKLCKQEHESLIYCPEFRKARIPDRFLLCMKTNSCYRCLRCDAGFIMKERHDWFPVHKPFCSDRYVCRRGRCVNNEPVSQNHILVCKFHEEENRQDHSDFLSSVDMSRVKENTKFFFAAPSVTGPMSGVYSAAVPGTRLAKQPIYMLQYLLGKNNERLMMFFDSGCVEATISDRGYSLMDTIPGRPGPIPLDVAGGQTIQNPYGYETFKLKKTDGSQVEVNALRMPEITTELPMWELSQAWNEVAKAYLESGGVQTDLPSCPDRVGGSSIDVMLGVEYMSCFPDLVFELPSGLRLYRSRLEAADGHLGILGGPSEAWAHAGAAVHIMGPKVFFTAEAKAVHSMNIAMKTSLKLEMPCVPEPSAFKTDVTRLQCSECHCWESVLMEDTECGENPRAYSVYSSISAELKKFQDTENIGGSVEYRCMVCRNCTSCKNGEFLEHLSLQEEKEQAQIEDCVTLDEANRTVYAKLPFIKDPEEHLKPNKRVAAKILDTQIRIICKTPGMRESVQKAHDKLVSRGHVVKLSDLPIDVQKGIAHGSNYFIPWRTVLNLGSLSTPRRLVYDASSRTPGGESLNDILARGMNKLGKLLHLLVKFRYGNFAFSADVQMAYNNLKLDPAFYKYQQYLWKEGLTAEEEAISMVVITVIYGVRPAGNLTIAGFQKIVEAAKELGGQYMVGALALELCSYMDDIFSAHGTRAGRDEAADGLKKVLHLGSMSVKAITKSGESPPEDVTADGTTVGVVGYKWSTADDRMKLDIKPLTLTKTKRGQPGDPIEGELETALTAKFTKRVLAGRVASVFDPLGLCTPITAQLKVDMSVACRLAEGWDSSLPPELIPTWVRNLEQIRELDEISVPRNVGVAKDGDYMFEMFVCVDASETVAVAAVYARTEPEPGVYECNLLLAKSKMADKCTIPKAELRAATLGANLGHVVRTNLGQYISNEYFLTDSTISLCWLHQDQRPLQISVRNSVIEVRRFSSLNDWYHVPSEDNAADIATRPVTVAEIKGDSDWFKGRLWMRGPKEDFPLRQIQDLKVSEEEMTTVQSEIRAKPARGMVLYCKVSRLADRYKFSQYLVDPCFKPWPKYLRVMATVIRCFKIWRYKSSKYKGQMEPKLFQLDGINCVIVNLTSADLEDARLYTFRKTSREVKYFNKPEAYKNLSVERDGILMYSGRILNGEKPDSIAGAMLDLGPLTFCQPIIDRYSPVSYSIMLHVHNSINHHGGARSTYRRSAELAHILKGSALSEEVWDSCPHCQRYKMRLLKAELGKIHPTRFTPAPPFYFCQSDLVGPWIARCENHPRNGGRFGDVKIWGAVFKCCTTLAIAVEVMSDYTAASYIDAYTRFSARYGHSGILYIDAGANLTSACGSMTISYADISKSINGKGVNMKHEVCVVGSHESQGLVERSIREVRKIFDAVFKGFELSVLMYQTAFTFIANELNNVPLCLGSKYANLDHLDLITPNRLLLGRNNLRAPVGLVTADVPSNWLQNMDDVGRAWWKVWEEEWLVNLVPKPSKWLKGDPDIRVGDIVVFMRDGKEADLGQTPWRTGQVVETHVSDRDEVCRSVTVKYQNHNERVSRYTTRSVRTMAVVHREGDLDLIGKLSQACIEANKHFMVFYNSPSASDT